MKTLPFVMTIDGQICAETIELLKPFWYYPYPDIDLREALLTNVQFELIRGMRLALTYLHATAAAVAERHNAESE